MAKRNLYSSASIFSLCALLQQIILGANTILGLQDTPYHKVVDSVVVGVVKKQHFSAALYCHGGLKDRKTYFCVQLTLSQMFMRQ